MKRLILAALTFALGMSAVAQIDNAKVIAVVNGEDIKAGDFYRRMEFLTGVGKVVGGSFVENTPAFWTLETIVNERIIMALAKEKNVTPSDAEVQQELRNRLETQPTMITDWEASGQTRAELERAIRIQLAQFKIATAGIIISDQEVDKFYKENPISFTIPKRVKLRVISVSDATRKAQVDLQLQQGKKFEDVAKALSEDITKEVGGDFGTIPLNTLGETVRKVIEALKVGGRSAWLDVGGGNQAMFLLEQILPEQLQPLDNPLRRSIRRRLMLDKGRVKTDVQKEMSAMRKKLQVDVKVPALNEEWIKFQQRLNSIGG